ncbi:glycosyltransferase family 117 protein [Phnomibacter ginsenosidimutans]|uniref:DUF2723 domain-containing protein n=1 Tax=Phnomibacter ginsenosidimutans TaxID=2676868 RepID=A0A6I6G7Z0_9BACT|nr:DUF2723 domain-containing protein [Phnomibacter ginsenosidimutans]QGW28517.1 DUF2723 domain-containing protein [Phnomibacter ginsenosidimutans]
MKFNRLNNVVGWIVFLIASAVYIMTAEKNGSLWDCGEFVASCFKLQIPHPPGAPMFVLIGRFFIVLFGDDPATAAKAVNIMSALASSFTILFLFWTITHFARKLVNPVVETITQPQALTIMGAGVVGALAYTFSDSFWYSAVEGEVYALSSFFTALVFWAMLKWEHQVDKDARTDAGTGHSNADRWIVFIFFMMGLSIGVHLLNLLTIPAIVMIYYFKRYTVTKWGTFWAFVIGCVITGVVQKFVIQYSIKGAGHFDILFVNDFGLPFFSGFTTFFVLLAVAIWFGLRMAAKKGWYYLRLGLWCLTFMLIGYSSYLTTMIRSSADPGVDMYNVDNPMSLVGYLGREQYGDFPLVYGQVFTAQSRNTSREEGAMRYQKSKDKYIELGNDVKEVYDPADMMFFPRVWDRSNDQQHANYYADVLGIGRTDDPKMQNPETGPYERRPTFADNIRFFVGYQTYWMYLRYFMWNFAGKQNDIQGVYASNVRDGNWITGISFIDDLIYGPQSAMPETIKNNKANNKLLGLPLILGLFGLFFQYYRHRKDFLVNGLLFFFTGMAIVVYLNQAGNQPRERDYAYVGSFYAFAVWIGLAVPAFVLLAKENAQKLLQKILIGAGVIYLVAAMSASIGTSDGKAFVGVALLGVFGTAVVAGIFYLVKALKSEKTMATGAIAITLLAAPLWMAAQEWDDHDRSNKTMAPDLAVDYLNSCAPNAILFSFGDNDTYPLWYAQEVMGIRRDVRVINYSLLGIDWYINQLRYKVNESDAMDVIWSPEQIEGDKLNYAFFEPRPGYEGAQNLYSIMKDWIGTADFQKMYNAQGEYIPVYPSNTFYVPVDKAAVVKNGTVKATDAIVDTIAFQVPKQVMLKNDLAVLAVIAGNNFKRPIYFTSKFDELGFQNYLRRDGMTYRLVPVANEEVNTEWAYEKMMKEFKFGNAEKAGVYFDEENRRHLNNLRQAYADVAVSLAANGQKDSAQKLLQRVDQMMDSTNMPYGLASRYALHNQTSLMLMEAAYRAGEEKLAKKIGAAVRKDLTEQMAYFAAIGDQRAERMTLEVQRTQMMLQMLDQMEEVLKRNNTPVVEGPVKIGGDTNAQPASK